MPTVIASGNISFAISGVDGKGFLELDNDDRLEVAVWFASPFMVGFAMACLSVVLL